MRNKDDVPTLQNLKSMRVYKLRVYQKIIRIDDSNLEFYLNNKCTDIPSSLKMLQRRIQR